MTSEEWNELRKVIREEVTPIVHGEIAAAEQRMSERQDRAVEALTTDLSEQIAEIRQEFAGVRGELATINERLDELAVVLARIDAGTSAALGRLDDWLARRPG